MTKFFKIYSSTNLIDVGHYPQIEEAIYDCDPLEDPQFVDNVGHQKIDFTPKIPVGILGAKAKVTDFLSSPVMGYTRKLIVSNKVRNIFEKNDIRNIQLFKCNIKTENSYSNYWLSNPIEFNKDCIDFNKSEFYLMKGVLKRIKKLKISSYLELEQELAKIQLMPDLYNLRIIGLALKENDNPFLVIDNVRGGIQYFVSEELKNEMEELRVTGINFDLIS